MNTRSVQKAEEASVLTGSDTSKPESQTGDGSNTSGRSGYTSCPSETVRPLTGGVSSSVSEPSIAI